MNRILSALLALALIAQPALSQSLDFGQVTTNPPAYLNNTAKPLSLDTFGNLRVADNGVADSATYTATVSSATQWTITPSNGTLGSITTDGFGSVTVQYSAIGNAGNRFRIEVSNDNTNWALAEVSNSVPVTSFSVQSGTSILPSLTQLVVIPVTGKYVRFSENTYVGGTDTATIVLRKAFGRGPLATSQGLGNTSTPWAVQGNIASGATDSGNPVKVGCVYNSTLPTFTNGQRGDCQIGTRGSLAVQIRAPDGTAGASVSAEGGLYTSPLASALGAASFLNIAAGQATTVVKASAGTLYSLCLNSAATATNTTIVYDNASGAGTVIGRPAATTATVPTCLSYGPVGLAFANGLTIITATANGSDMTVSYK